MTKNMPHRFSPPAPMDHKGRVRRLQGSLADAELDSLLITHLPNICYLTGFTGSSAVVVVDERRCILFTDGRYRSQAQEEVKGAKIEIASKSPLIAAAEWLLKSPAARAARYRAKSPSSVGIESESISAAARDRLAAQLKGKARLRAAPQFIERARIVKDADEIGRIRQAVELGASIFKVATKKIRPGVSEVEVAGAMEYAARRAGADGMAFPTILASGTRSAIIHGRASQARIPARGFVVCDFGVILAGYCSDRTRTFHVGMPTADARHLYASVLEAQHVAISAVRPGATAAEVDAAARSVLKRQKWDRFFTHSTGHGLGLEIHEAPRLALGQDQRLEPGMVITIEPGAYIPGKWGVRIEDVVVVTSTSCEVLTPTDKDLVAIY
jgi:Xaa-Pro aminopeptidase